MARTFGFFRGGNYWISKSLLVFQEEFEPQS